MKLKKILRAWFFMVAENVILHELTDEEIKNLTDEEVYNIGVYQEKNGVPVESTVKGLLKSLDIKYDDLSDFVLDLFVGVCNNANRTKNQIYISRKSSPLKDNIIINLDDNNDIPYVTIQIQIGDSFIHEEAYTKEGVLLYKS